MQTNVDVSTKWNSTSDMIATASKLKPALNALCANYEELAHLKICEDKWKLFLEVQNILKHFKTLSIVYLVVRNMPHYFLLSLG